MNHARVMAALELGLHTLHHARLGGAVVDHKAHRGRVFQHTLEHGQLRRVGEHTGHLGLRERNLQTLGTERLVGGAEGHAETHTTVRRHPPVERGAGVHVKTVLAVHAERSHARGETVHHGVKVVEGVVLVRREHIVRPLLGLGNLVPVDILGHLFLLGLLLEDFARGKHDLLRVFSLDRLHELHHCVAALRQAIDQVFGARKRAVHRALAGHLGTTNHHTRFALLQGQLHPQLGWRWLQDLGRNPAQLVIQRRHVGLTQQMPMHLPLCTGTRSIT